MRHSFKFFALLFCLYGASSFVQAQRQPAIGEDISQCKSRFEAVYTSPSGSSARLVAVNTLLKFNEYPACLARLIIKSQPMERAAFADFVKFLEAHRMDKQEGATTGSGGSTNLVSKGIAAQILSLAAEYGALTESVNNQVVTVQGSLDGIPMALLRQDLLQYCPKGNPTVEEICVHRTLVNWLRRISYGVSFDISRNSQSVAGTPTGTQQGNTQQVTFTPDQHQVSSVVGRLVLWSTRDATSDSFQKQWRSALIANGAGANTSSPSPAFIDSAAGNLLKAGKALLDDVGTTFTESQSLHDALNAAPDQVSVDTLVGNAISDQLKSDAKLVQNAGSFLQSLDKFVAEEDAFVTALAEKPVLTLEYNNNRPVGQSPVSTFRLIFDKGFTKEWSLTANGAVAMNDENPPATVPGASRLRDAQFGFQLQHNFSSFIFSSPAALSGSYYFQYQNSPAILNVTPGTPLPGITITGLSPNATQIFSQKGNLHIGQIKLMLGVGQSTMRIPLAVSYSNRTELINKPLWRGQIGITYDFDSFLGGK